MKKSRILLGLLAIFILIFFIGCSGDKSPGSQKTSDTAGEESVTVTDSPEVQKEAQALLDKVDSGITDLVEAEKVKKELEALLEKAKTPELLDKIAEAIEKVDQVIVVEKAKQNLSATISELNSQIDALKSEISSISIKDIDSAKKAENAVNQINKLMANLNNYKETIKTLEKVMGETEPTEEQEKLLAEMKKIVEEQEKVLKEYLSQAVAKKVELTDNKQLSEETNQTISQIGKLVADITSIFDQSKLDKAKSLIDSIASAKGMSDLDTIETEIKNIKTYVESTLNALLSKKAALEAMIAQAEELYKNLPDSNPDKAKLKKWLDSALGLNIEEYITELQTAKSSIEQAFKTLTNKEIELKKELNDQYNELAEKVQKEISALNEEVVNKIETVEKAQNRLAEIEKIIEKEDLGANELEKLEKEAQEIEDQLEGIDIEEIVNNIEEKIKAANKLLIEAEDFDKKSKGYLKDLISNLKKLLQKAIAKLDDVKAKRWNKDKMKKNKDKVNKIKDKIKEKKKGKEHAVDQGKGKKKGLEK